MRPVSFCLMVVLLIFSCGKQKTIPPESSEAEQEFIRITASQFQQNNMVLGTLEEKHFPQLIPANGMIDVPPEHRVRVSAVMGGYVKSIPLIVGDQVKRGQPVAVLENPEFVALQQRYLEVKEQLPYLKSEYERQQVLLSENISSEKSYLKTESNYKTALARYKGLQKQLELLNIPIAQVEQGNIITSVSIYAPIPGHITQVLVSKGAFVSPTSPLLEIIDHSDIHLELSVFERDIMKIEKGQSIQFKIPEITNQSFEGEVRLVGTLIDSMRTVQVHGHLLDENHRLLTGMFVEASIVTTSKTGLALPNEAIVEVQNAKVAFRLTSKEAAAYVFEKVQLKTGPEYEGYTQIDTTASFDVNDKFLFSGAYGLIAD